MSDGSSLSRWGKKCRLVRLGMSDGSSLSRWGKSREVQIGNECSSISRWGKNRVVQIGNECSSISRWGGGGNADYYILGMSAVIFPDGEKMQTSTDWE